MWYFDMKQQVIFEFHRRNSPTLNSFAIEHRITLENRNKDI